jgi:hypothetical protein
VSELEDRYRAALRWYPRKWRSANEDVVVGTLLDVADDDHRTKPAKGELANLRHSGIQTWIARTGGAIPRDVRERAAVIALALGLTLAVSGIYYSVVFFEFLRTFIDPRFSQIFLIDIGPVYYLVWIAASVSALVGARRAARALVVISVPLSIAVPLVSNALHFSNSPGVITIAFLDVLAAIYLAGSPLRSRRMRGSLAVAATCFLVSDAAILIAQKIGQWGAGSLWVDYFWGQFAVWLVWLGIPAVIVAGIILWRRSRSPWAPALLIAAIPVVPLALFEFAYSTSWLDNLSTFIGLVVLIAIVITVLRLFGLRVRVTRS